MLFYVNTRIYSIILLEKSSVYTIQLLYENEPVLQPLMAGIDPGRTNIGVSVVNGNAEPVFSAVVETRNKDILSVILLIGLALIQDVLIDLYIVIDLVICIYSGITEYRRHKKSRN